MTHFTEGSDEKLNQSVTALNDLGWFQPQDSSSTREVVGKSNVDIKVQRNSGTVIGVQVIAQFGRMLEPRSLGDELIDVVERVFQKPAFSAEGSSLTFDQVADEFLRPGAIVVIGGKGGSGRTITALALLGALRSSRGTAVSTIGYGASKEFQHAKFPQDENHGFLLELPTDDEEFSISSNFGIILREVQKILLRQSSRLVVVTTDEQWQRIGFGAPVRAVEIVHVSRLGIAHAWLRLEAPDVADASWVRDSEIKRIVDNENSPQGVMEVVRMIIRAGRAEPDKLPRLDELTSSHPLERLDSVDIDSRRRIASVVAARKSWRPQLLKWHQAMERSGFERNFLLAAAVLPGMPAGEVYIAARTLAKRFGESPPGIGQQGPGVIQLADLVEGELVGENDTLEFSRPGWEDAVLQYFWVDRPETRRTFLTWIAQAPLAISREASTLAPSASSANKLERVERMASFALRWASRQKRPEFLSGLVTEWHKNEELWPFAVEALTKACFDTAIDKSAHSLLLNWSQLQKHALLTAVADVCAGDFGHSYPGKALVRLAHVGESDNQGVREAARQAIQSLWSDHPLRSTLLSEILKWCRSDSSARRVAGRRAFVALAEIPYADASNWPDLLAGHDEMTETDIQVRLEQVAEGWHHVLSASVLEVEWRASLIKWFETCLFYPEARQSLIRVFHDAVSRPALDGSVLHHRLHDLLYEWDHEADDDQLRSQVRYQFADAMFPHGLAYSAPICRRDPQ